jgi:replicative DNA helicase
MTIPESFEGSIALQFIQSQGWNWRTATEPNIEIENCPHCKHDGFHFRMSIYGAESPYKNKDGLYSCMRCGKGGNLYALKQALGVVIPGLESRKDFAAGERKVEALPDIDQAHQALLEDADVMDYLVNVRGFSREIIERQKLGIVPKRYFRETGEVKALVYPYLVGDNAVFVHYRTLPPTIKAFSSPAGWTVPLYNGEILNREAVTDVIFVEGEPDCIAAMDHGVENICGVPGANFKKAEWIDSLDKVERVYICYDKDNVGQKAAQELANRIGIEKCWKIVLPDFEITTESGVTRLGKDLNEYFTLGGYTAQDFQKLKEEAELFDVAGVSSSKTALQELYDELSGKEGLEPKYKMGWKSLDTLVGFDEGDVIDILAPEKIGKGGLTTTLSMTYDGKWKALGELKVGDKLASVDGQPSEVTGVYPRGVLPMYKVTFSDGRSTVTTSDHLWKVAGATEWERQKWRIYTTDAVANEYCYTGNRRSQKLYIPLVSGDYGSLEALPLHPWMLGAMIGDGCMRESGLSYATADKELANRMDYLGYSLTRPSGINYRFQDAEHVRFWLKELGLYGHTANSKFIPKMYLEADKESRWELLRGLMDTDGTAGNRNGTPSYCTVSKQLAEDFVYLVRSLGGLAKVTKPKKTSFRYKGELRTGQDAYNIVVRFPSAVRKDVFSLERKKAQVNAKNKLHDPRLTFERIEYVGDFEAVCISVSHPSKLYITDDFIVTHNTTFAMNIMEHMVDTYKEDGVFICLEMTRSRMARKWIAHKAQIEDNIAKNKEEAIALKEAFMEAIPVVQKSVANREGDFYFCYPKYTTVDDIYSLIRDCIRRYGVKWIAIDNIQRLCDTTLGGKNRTQHLSEISKVISQIAKDFNVQIIRILQPHRVPAGKIATSDNVDGASQIGKDCDSMMILHRERLGGEVNPDDIEGYLHEEASFSDNMLVTVGLSRYSGGGRTTMHYYGATSTIMEKDEGQIAKMKAQANKGVGYQSQLASLKVSLNPAAGPIADDAEVKL